MSFTVTVIDSTSVDFPASLRTRDGTSVFPSLWAIGNLAILERRLLGFFCSTRCPGEVILQTYDFARALRDAEAPVISGFHSPMEKECLDLLLRGTQPLVICPARSIERMRVPTTWGVPLVENWLLILSPFNVTQRRATADLAEKRNAFVAALANKIFVAYAAPGSKTEQFSLDLLTRGNNENVNLLALGARPVRPEDLHEH